MKSASFEIVPFVRRNWWGLFCLFLLFVSLVVGLGRDIHPSSSLNGIVFFAKESPDSVLLVNNPPEIFNVQITGQEDLRIEKFKITNERTSYKISHEGQVASIQGLKPELNVSDIEKQWNRDPVSIEKLPNGSYRIKAGFDIPGSAVNGIYEVKDHTIHEHYFESSRIVISIMALTLLAPLYFVGKLCGWFLRKIKH